MQENKSAPAIDNKKPVPVFKGPNVTKEKITKKQPPKNPKSVKKVTVIKKDTETIKVNENKGENVTKTETYDINKIKSRQEIVKNRQAEIAPLLGDPKNKDLVQEYDELIKESLSIEKRLNEIKTETPELEQTTKEGDAKDKKIIIETNAEKKTSGKEKTAENTENKKIELELDKNLEIARNKYIEEYK
ncbi:MAG: hypothetical protein NTV03_00710, partial [Candidatus Nomurabacteria bacterium]|nr:hypothetical protein [Candidatus Nomurabacteria bacterium]